ncbi:MAG: pentapeptide repeat-containing protein [Anaerolineae bacterium]
MAQESSRWKTVKRVLVRLLVIAGWLIVALVIVGPPAWAVYTRLTQGGWPDWSGIGEFTDPAGEFHPTKTLWDLWDLLVIPAVLAAGGLLFNRAERRAEREAEERRRRAEREAEERRARTEHEIASDRFREEALQRYLDHMTESMLNQGLRTSEPDSETRDIARARTLTVLRGLDGARKGILLRFLHESDLIRKGEAAPIISLSKADLVRADLRAADLHGANLSKTNLQWANLHGARLSEADLRRAKLGPPAADLREADLRRADLREAILRTANLRGADLCGADLRGADLRGADLRGADLRGADLRGATVTDEQLAHARSLEGAIMPDGTEHE